MNQRLHQSEESGPKDKGPSFGEWYPIVCRISGVRIASLARAFGLSFDDRRDLQQDVTLHVWRCLHRFDPTRAALRTFIENVIANYLKSAIRKLQSAKRQAPLNEASSGYVSSGAEEVHLRIDVARVLRTLPPSQRCVGLMLAIASSSEVSRSIGLSRGSICRTMVQLRVAFRAAGLQPGAADRRDE